MKKISTASIVLADLVGSRSEASLSDYAEMLREFQQLSLKAVEVAQDRWGSEGMTLLPRTIADEISVCTFGPDDAMNAVLAATISFELKLRWYTSQFIRRRLDQGKPLIDLAIGITCGRITVDGYSPDIARAKQLQEYARNNNLSLVQCDRKMYSLLLQHPDIITFFAEAQYILLDGNREATYELIDCKHSHFTENQLLHVERQQVLECADCNPSALWIYSSLSYRDYKAGKYDVAISMAQDILSKSDNRRYLPAQVLIAQCKFRQYEFPAVVEQLETVQEKTHPLIASYLGVAARNTGQFYKAQRVLEASQSSYPKNPYISNAIAFTIANAYISGTINDWIEEYESSPNFIQNLAEELWRLGMLPDSESRRQFTSDTLRK